MDQDQNPNTPQPEESIMGSPDTPEQSSGSDAPTQDFSSVQSYTGTELDPALDVDFDLDDWEDDQNDMTRTMIMAAGGLAALGVLALILRKRSRPKTGLAAVMAQVEDTTGVSGKDVQEAVASVAENVQKAAATVDLSGVDLPELLDELRSRARDAHLDREARDAINEARRRVRTVAREGGKALDNVDTADLGRRARRAGRDLRKQAADFDAGDAQQTMAQFTDRVVEAIDNLRQDLAPTVRHRAADVADLADENLPKAREAARGAAENLRDLLGRGRDQGAQLIEERGPAVQKAAGEAGAQANKLADLIKVAAFEAVTYIVKELLPSARKRGEQAAERVKDDTAPFVRHRAADVAGRVREDTLPFVQHRATDVMEYVLKELAPRARKVARQAPDRAREAADTVAPVVGDAAQQAADLARAAVETGRDRVGEVMQDGSSRVGDAAGAVRDGVGGGITQVNRRAHTVVRETKKTTGYLTKESSGLLIWLAALGGLILLVFVPDKERQAEIWRTIRQLVGEVQQMWTDFQGDEFSLDLQDPQDYTGDQA